MKAPIHGKSTDFPISESKTPICCKKPMQLKASGGWNNGNLIFQCKKCGEVKTV